MPAEAAHIEVGNAAAPTPKGKVRLLSLDRLDGRTSACKRAKELIENLEADLGGVDRLSEGSRQLCQRAAILGTYIESCEAQWLAGQPVALADYLAAINAQRRVLATIGLKRVPREALTLEQHLTQVARERTDASADEQDNEADVSANDVAADDENASAA